MTVLWVAIGGALGSVLRYWVSDPINQRVAPWGTILVNLVGTFALGVLIGWFGKRSSDSVVRVALSVGLLGGFTTFSSWAVETIDLLSAGRIGTAMANIVIPLAIGLVAASAGLAVGRLV